MINKESLILVNAALPLVSNLSPAVLFDVVMHQRYGVQYQPIVNLQGEVFGYEALARFFDDQGRAISPVDVFDALHHSPLSLFDVELAMKQMQLHYAPHSDALFVNLDPHAVDAWGVLDKSNPLLELLCNQDKLRVELIENTDITDARITQQLVQFFQHNKVLLALDDLGAPDSLLSLDVLIDVDYVKFDRSWLQKLQRAEYQKLFVVFLDFIKACNKKSILEGIEVQEHLDLARKFKVDYVQGFFYKAQFIDQSH